MTKLVLWKKVTKERLNSLIKIILNKRFLNKKKMKLQMNKSEFFNKNNFKLNILKLKLKVN